jgi:GT2 family glycosyltransferase
MKFSIVIPTCDRPAQLQECLLRVMAQEASSYEVIVSDDSRAATQQYAADGLRRVQGPQGGPAANRNCGARHATGEWLVFLDDDCLPAPGWLAAYEAAAAPGLDVLEGRTECPHADGFTFHDIVENVVGGAYWSCNLAVRRERFEELGGFDEDFTQACAEDMEFAHRMRARGLKSQFVEAALVIHPPRPVSAGRLLGRTAAHRWILLYRLKTGVSPGLDCSAPRAIADLIVREWLDSLRLFHHLGRRANRRRLKQMTLEALWCFVSLPAFLPYYLFWELRFRRMLSRRARSRGNG